MVIVFLTQTIIAMVRLAPKSTSTLALSSVVPLDFWLWVKAGETAAWRLKWVAIPVTIFAMWGGRKIYRSMLKSPERFCGWGYARAGLVASAVVPVLIAVLIGVTVPERLRQRQVALQAASYAMGYRLDRALLEYRAKFGTLPAEMKDLGNLPDPDGSLAAALITLDASLAAAEAPVRTYLAYKPSADFAALPKRKSRTLRGAVIRNASLDTATDDSPAEGLSFTNYELPLPGPDKLMGTEDDLIVADGVIKRASESVRRPGTPTVSTKSTRP